MAITATTLVAAITANQTQFAVTSTTGFPAVGSVGQNQLMKIDTEYMYCTGVPVSGIITVRGRGSESTSAVAHDVLAFVQTSATATDWPTIPAGSVEPIPDFVNPVVTLGQNQTLTTPNQSTTYVIDKASAATITVVAPSTAQDGLELCFSSTTAAAHVVSGTSLIADAVSGSPHSTCTFAAFKGTSLKLRATQGLWSVASQTGVTVT